MKVTEGPCTGYFGKEPEYEQWASWGPQIFQKDPGAAVMLSNEVDKLGMDTNEAGWVVGWVMECYQKGALKKEDLDGLEMTWGNVAATLALLKNIAHRRGYGATLAEGVKHAAEKLGGESVNWAIFTGKRNSPRGHDHRGRWVEMVDTIVSDTGTLATQMLVVNKDLWKIPNPMDIFDPDHVVQAEANSMGSMTISDCLVQCWFTGFNDTETQTEAINAATGWNMSLEEVMKVGRRVVNMMRLYNLKVGLTPDKETPSARYCSQSVDGPNKDKPITPHWEKMLDNYYQLMGWDRKTGRPLPETIKELALEDFAK
jgi:aldehyde:ferredoxin oxidoreductase